MFRSDYVVLSSPSSSAAAAAAPTPLMGPPPTLDQLRALTALPSHMMGNRSSKRRQTGKKERLARDGQIVSKEFDTFGSRPYPTNGISLEQSITLELSTSLGAFLTSSTTVGIPVFAGRAFTLSDFSAATSLATVFDQYRFEQSKCGCPSTIQTALRRIQNW